GGAGGATTGGTGGVAPGGTGGVPTTGGTGGVPTTGGTGGVPTTGGTGGVPTTGGTGGVPTTGGTGGVPTTGGTGGGATGGAAGATGGAGGAGGATGGAGGASGGSGGMAGSGGSVVVGACDWTRQAAECADVACVLCNPDQYNTYCGMACQTLVDCIEENDGCSTPEDPLCGMRSGQQSTPNVCTTEYDSASTEPRAQALLMIECVCGGS